jgi:hypothetical protein
MHHTREVAIHSGTLFPRRFGIVSSMANPEQLKNLRQGVKSWNQPDFTPIARRLSGWWGKGN